MINRKYTDDIIIEALKLCGYTNLKGQFCKIYLIRLALDLIMRRGERIADLEDENKGLKETNEHLSGEYITLSKEKDNLIRTYAECQKEAIKEFAERMKENRNRIFNTIYSDYHFSEIIDTLAKEMTEGKQ